jgi:hypothetical protein
MSSVIFFTFRLYPLLFDYFKSERTSSIVLVYKIFLSAGDSVVEASARAVSVLDGSRLMRLYECKSSHSMAIIFKSSCAVECYLCPVSRTLGDNRSIAEMFNEHKMLSKLVIRNSSLDPNYMRYRRFFVCHMYTKCCPGFSHLFNNYIIRLLQFRFKIMMQKPRHHDPLSSRAVGNPARSTRLLRHRETLCAYLATGR